VILLLFASIMICEQTIEPAMTRRWTFGF